MCSSVIVLTLDTNITNDKRNLRSQREALLYFAVCNLPRGIHVGKEIKVKGGRIERAGREKKKGREDE